MSHERVATFKIAESYTDKMDEIRKIGFPIKGSATTLRDPFDDKGKCIHLTLEMGNELLVYHRFTDNLNNRKLVMQHWSEEKAPVPSSGRCMEMGRFVVAPKYRNILGLFESFILMGLIYARNAGYDKVATGIKNERNLITRCEKLGFVLDPIVYECKIPNCESINARTLIYDLKKNGNRLDAAYYQATKILFEHKQLKLNKHFLKVITPIPRPGVNAKIRSNL